MYVVTVRHLERHLTAGLIFSESLLNDGVIFIFVRLPTQFQHVTVLLTISGGSIKIEKWPHTEGYAWSARCDGLGGRDVPTLPNADDFTQTHPVSKLAVQCSLVVNKS
jgi:hypothetical protein